MLEIVRRRRRREYCASEEPHDHAAFRVYSELAIMEATPCAAASCAVMVRVRGPDPKSRKMQRHAFYSLESDDTTLSASGILLPVANESTLVITSASIVEPFLMSRQLDGAPELNFLEFVRGTTLEVLIQTPVGLSGYDSRSLWVPARLFKLLNVSLASKAVESLLDVQGGEGVWEMGWTLGNSQEFLAENLVKDKFALDKEVGLHRTTSTVAGAFTSIAVLSMGIVPKLEHNLTLSKSCGRGDVIKAVGSPFGALSPLHFFNSTSVGNVSNCWPSSSCLILMADIRVLPGMEGGPVFDAADNLAGILLRPLRQRNSGVEVQLVLTAKALVSALETEGINVIDGEGESREINNQIHGAIPSVVLVTVGGGTWASGIVINKTGLVLTNAHLLEPWRFGKPKATSVLRDEPLAFPYASQRPHPRVQVRLDGTNGSVWQTAEVVFISHGPLDVALLQLHSVPSDLEPILVEAAEPTPGTPAVVIGHGLFGPRAALGPSVTMGVVSRVVKTGDAVLYKQALESNTPVMLQTTAAVHPGGSGGAVVNNQGRMIGLVTSNAKHSGMIVIPHLNFSIPTAALTPVFEFAASGDISVLSELNMGNRLLSAVWSMVDPLKVLPQRLLDRLKQQGKGSQFAEFITENEKREGLESRL